MSSSKNIFSKAASSSARARSGTSEATRRGLVRMVDKGDVELVKALIAGGADVNARDIRGYTPLHEAAASGHMTTALVLIEHGANINARGSHGWTPLHEAAGAGQAALAKVLIARGADMNIKDRSGGTPLERAEERRKSEAAQVIREAVSQRHARQVKAVACSKRRRPAL